MFLLSFWSIMYPYHPSGLKNIFWRCQNSEIFRFSMKIHLGIQSKMLFLEENTISLVTEITNRSYHNVFAGQATSSRVWKSDFEKSVLKPVTQWGTVLLKVSLQMYVKEKVDVFHQIFKIIFFCFVEVRDSRRRIVHKADVTKKHKPHRKTPKNNLPKPETVHKVCFPRQF